MNVEIDECDHEWVIGEVKEDAVCNKCGAYSSEMPDDYPR
jgi:hypothetical protein